MSERERLNNIFKILSYVSNYFTKSKNEKAFTEFLNNFDIFFNLFIKSIHNGGIRKHKRENRCSR